MVWPEAPSVEAEEVERYRREVAGHNMSVVALQSLVFGVKDVALFGGKYSASD